jgi:ribosome-binding ATPase YchF (GTP1/OBG family)
MIQIGLLGKPNVGKSTFFKAATLKDVEIANYPFTTIKPNLGATHVRVKCPHTEIGMECNPRKGMCIGGTRFVPVGIYDVAGLVPGAHEGKGLGNQFLDDVRRSNVLVMIVDATGRTDFGGNEGEGNPIEDVRFVLEEYDRWTAGIVTKALHSRTGSVDDILKNALSGLEIKPEQVDELLKSIRPSGDCLEFASRLRQTSKPLIIAANKLDSTDERWLKELGKLGHPVVPVSSIYEVTLRKANEAGLISYVPGAGDFKITGSPSPGQEAALERIRTFLKKFGSTGVQEVLDRSVFELGGQIAAFPVEDEGHWTDSKGNVLPDCFLVDRGTTTKQLAYAIHTDIGEGFVKAIDGRNKKALGADHEVENRAVIKIFSRK